MSLSDYDVKYRAELTEFQRALVALDSVLTCKPKDAEHNARQRRFIPEEFITSGDPFYYLADGGYSRLGFSLSTGRVYLTSNSLEWTRTHWDDATGERDNVESLLITWLHSQGYNLADFA